MTFPTSSESTADTRGPMFILKGTLPCGEGPERGGNCVCGWGVGRGLRGSFWPLRMQAGLGEAGSCGWPAPHPELDLQRPPLRVPDGSPPPPSDCPQD